MAYRDQLYPWCIVRSPDVEAVEAIVVARFRRRTDADAQLKILRQMTPHRTFTIVFERVVIEPSDSTQPELLANQSDPSDPA